MNQLKNVGWLLLLVPLAHFQVYDDVHAAVDVLVVELWALYWLSALAFGLDFFSNETLKSAGEKLQRCPVKYRAAAMYVILIALGIYYLYQV